MRAAEFKWGELSRKQAKVLTWWTSDEYKDYNGIVADGAIRSGKTTSMAFSFVIWAMTTFNAQNFAMCGKTIESLRRNVIVTLRRQLRQRGYRVKERQKENLLLISKGNRNNSFYLFGGKDEGSQDLIQGITLAGLFCDEVALMPESFVNQATARCSVDGSKFWFNCNPSGPFHWFYQNWIQKCRERKLVYLHFTMEDNRTLTEAIKERYRAQYIGVFFKRYILGLWVAAEGIIYDMFNSESHIVRNAQTEGDCYVSSDYGIQNATVFLLWQKEKGTQRWIAIREYYYSGRDNKVQKTVAQLADGLEAMLNGIKPRQIILDPSATAMAAELRRRGYHVRGADNDVTNGISDVSTMLYQNRLAFDISCKGTIEEFGVYAWDEKAANRGEDKPIKEHDHAMDAVRYFVYTLKLVKPKDEYRSVLG